MKIHYKALLLFILTTLLAIQNSNASIELSEVKTSNKVDTLLTIHNRVLKYTEISKDSLNEITIDLNAKLIVISTHSKLGSKNNTVTYSIKEIKINSDLFSKEMILSSKNSTSIFSGLQVKSCGRGFAMLALANNMIAQGMASGNAAQVNYGHALASMAYAIIEAECHIF